jgi:hypothetical protein
MLLVLISPFILVLVCAEQGLAEYTGTFYLGYKALDRWVYGDVVIDVEYVNPVVYYSYRNAYVVPFNLTFYEQHYGISSPLSPEVFVPRAQRAVQEIRAMSINASYSVDYGPYGSYLSYIVISNYTRLDSDLKVAVISIIGSAFRGLNSTIRVYERGVLDLIDLYLSESRVVDTNSTLGEAVSNAVNKAIATINNNSEDRVCFSLILSNGYWLRVWISKTYSECSNAVQRFVKTYVDEIRKFIPEDKPIYIELAEGVVIQGYKDLPLLVDPVRTMWSRIVTLAIIGALIAPPVVAVIFLVRYVKRRRP